MSQRRSAGRLYRLHLGLAALGVALVAGVSAFIAAGIDLGLPSPGEVAVACDRWISAGGVSAIALLAVGAIALASVVLGLRSARRQLLASRRYLEALPISAHATNVDGSECRLIETDAKHAFCAGFLRPRVHLSRGALDELSDEELRAVVSHEVHHVRRRDPLRLLVARSLADGLFFIPLLRRSSERYAALGELAADEAAVRVPGGRQPLASALLRLSASEGQPAGIVGIAPERVDHLTGDPDAGRWHLPASLAGPSAVALVGLAALLGALAHGLVGANIDLPIVLAALCMVAMIGGPIVLALGAISVSRRTLRARRT